MIKIVKAHEMKDLLERLFLKYSFTEDKAKLLAAVHTENTLHGINSHGINRVPFFIDQLKRGLVNKLNEAENIESFGNLERWDGNLGPGVINAIKCTNRSIELACENGMGLVALRNTNHWMRGGYYGWMAAERGCISILFTNTEPNMPAWGGKETRLGNNPLVISIPRKEGHIVLDMAMSQFAFGKINEYKLRGEQLPYDGGWDEDHNLSKDPEKILDSKSGLPIGFWKGSALSMILDMLATVLSAGRSTSELSKDKYESGVSQVYLCISPKKFADQNLQERLIEDIINYTHDVTPTKTGEKTHYPGERSFANKISNTKNGMKVNQEIWDRVVELAAN
ncbi:MAG: 3-dehydro-L-gulonate 2-dehydrogenase [Cyclobacteriaceae bacterium]